MSINIVLYFFNYLEILIIVFFEKIVNFVYYDSSSVLQKNSIVKQIWKIPGLFILESFKSKHNKVYIRYVPWTSKLYIFYFNLRIQKVDMMVCGRNLPDPIWTDFKLFALKHARSSNDFLKYHKLILWTYWRYIINSKILTLLLAGNSSGRLKILVICFRFNFSPALSYIDFSRF